MLDVLADKTWLTISKRRFIPVSFLELRKAVQKQEEEKKQCEKNIDELQEKNESLKSDLTKAEKERKELSHKVGAHGCLALCYRGARDGWVGGWVGV